jgi:hypothetical protein
MSRMAYCYLVFTSERGQGCSVRHDWGLKSKTGRCNLLSLLKYTQPPPLKYNSHTKNLCHTEHCGNENTVVTTSRVRSDSNSSYQNFTPPEQP